MFWLSLGVLIWIFGHGFKTFFPKTRHKIAERMGEEKSKGPFALSVFVSIVLIVIGWRSSSPADFLYQPLAALRPVAGILILLGLYFIANSTAPLRMRRWIRHPQLTGMALWSGAHLLLNGEVRSVILFGGFCIWSIASIPFINKRDGAYKPAPAGPIGLEIKAAVITLIVLAVLVATHGFFTARPLIAW